VLSRFGTRPGGFLAGVMCVSFGFSMFMSNTATTAMMLALLAPVVASFDPDDPFRRALLLGTATAANLGGMGSLIGTPPNAIAAGALAQLPGQHVDFLRWVAIGLPPATLLSIVAWLCLLRWYPSRTQRLDFKATLGQRGVDEGAVPRWKWWVVVLTVSCTVALWMTGGWHHLPTAVVSLLPIVLLTTTAILGPTEIRGLPWDVLFLLAGGLALGETVRSSGLAQWFIDQAPVTSSGALGIALGMSYLCVVLSNFMSNTAAANILIPFGIGIASGFESSVALPLALSASTAMCLPIATPPNALVYSTGGVTTRDFVRIGLLLGVIAPWVLVAWTAWLT
jgi:sodium-dependent dicarboxylate transporter 2/3/5